MSSNTEDKNWTGNTDIGALMSAYNKAHGIREASPESLTGESTPDNHDLMTTREIAEHMDLSERRVQRILESGLARFVKNFYMYNEIKKALIDGVPEEDINLDQIEKNYYADGRKRMRSVLLLNKEVDYSPDQRGTVWQQLRFLSAQ